MGAKWRMDNIKPIPDFLKSTVKKRFVGTYIPNKIVLLDKEQLEVDLTWITHTDIGTIIFLLSPTCTACDPKIINEFIRLNPLMNYAIFFHLDDGQTAEDFFQEDHNVKLYNCDIRIIDDQIDCGSIVPFMLVVNKIGKIFSGNIYNHIKDVEMFASTTK